MGALLPWNLDAKSLALAAVKGGSLTVAHES